MITHRVKGSAVYGQLDDLDGGIFTRLNSGVGWQRDLRQADGTRVGVLGGTNDAELGDHDVGHVGRTAVGAVCAESHVDEKLGGSMTLEPARLKRDSATTDGPVGTVGRDIHAAARIYPLHAIGPRLVGDEVIASPAGIDEDTVRRGEGGAENGGNQKGKHDEGDGTRKTRESLEVLGRITATRQREREEEKDEKQQTELFLYKTTTGKEERAAGCQVRAAWPISMRVFSLSLTRRPATLLRR